MRDNKIKRLERRLKKARALAERGGTPGEREAARLAVERLEERLIGARVVSVQLGNDYSDWEKHYTPPVPVGPRRKL